MIKLIEKDYERYLLKRVKGIGGLCYKWVSPGNAGVPDRIVIYEGDIFLVEMKKDDGKLRPSQTAVHNRLRREGIEVYTLYNRDDVDRFIDEVMMNAKNETVRTS